MTARAKSGFRLRRALPSLSLLLCAAVIYDIAVFYSRSREARTIERKRAATEAEQARRTLELLGGDKLKILAFYASPPVIHAGDSTLLCFGVNAATTVRIDPPVEQLHPALSRCFNVSPRRDTDYKLIAEDASGHTETQSLSIRVTR